MPLDPQAQKTWLRPPQTVSKAFQTSRKQMKTLLSRNVFQGRQNPPRWGRVKPLGAFLRAFRELLIQNIMAWYGCYLSNSIWDISHLTKVVLQNLPPGEVGLNPWEHFFALFVNFWYKNIMAWDISHLTKIVLLAISASQHICDCQSVAALPPPPPPPPR